MNVLFPVWELDPFFKIGGLGDVARALPGALKKLGVDIRVMVPYYKVVKMGRNKKVKVGKLHMQYAGKKETVEIWEVIHPYMNVPAYFLKNSNYLDRVASIDTWGFFDKAVVAIIKNNTLAWQPDIVHVNDCHCGLIPLSLQPFLQHTQKRSSRKNLVVDSTKSSGAWKGGSLASSTASILILATPRMTLP